MILRFGKFQGRHIQDPEVTVKYLEWLLYSSMQMVEAIEVELSRRKRAESGSLTAAERLVEAGFRSLLKESKGDPDAFNEITSARAILDEVLKKFLKEQPQ